MTSFEAAAQAFENGRRQYEEAMSSARAEKFCATEKYGQDKSAGSFQNRMALGDNLSYMAHLIKNEGLAGKLQLIYVDPPFFSNGKYQASVRLNSESLGDSGLIKAGAYDDRWGQDLKQYLTMLTARLFMMKELLSEQGCLWVHLDWHVVHYVKLILDGIFGEENFVNEVIWTYKSGGANKRSFARKHDTLLFYAKSGDYYFKRLKEKSYNRDYKPYRFKGVKEYSDDKGWYTMVNMKDVWNIDMVGRTSSERNGYATQKPEKLLERIVEACSRKGDICADFFAGSGTLGAVCQKAGRGWIMCDSGKVSAACMMARMAEQEASFTAEHSKLCGEDEKRDDIMCGRKGAVKARIDDGEVVLEDYSLSPDGEYTDLAMPGVDIKSSDEIKRYLENDSLSLIKCWSVDEQCDGTLHMADKIMTEGQLRYRLRNRDIKAVSIAGYDVFGNAFSQIID